MKKRIAALLLIAAVCTGMSACAAGRTGSETRDPVVGGWTLTAGKTAAALPEEVQAAFSAAAGEKLVPIALIGEQIVAGTNEMLLCAEDGAYRMIVLYRNLQGGAEITRTSDFVLTDYTHNGDREPGEPLAGGWYVPEAQTVLPLPESAQTAFEKACGSFVGSSIEPMVLLGTQVVAGTNYAILCRVTPVYPDALSSVQVVTVYADLKGNAEFTGFSLIDPAEFNK
ncbi:MAG: hypothetical protein J6P31_02335 [Oscillospiraceae bacterium]|nr:hypothetical protein [Oscillospiraceae bacterium]